MKVLYLGIKNGKQAQKKHAELEEKRGLKLSKYSAHGGFVFQPILHKDIESSNNKKEIDAVFSSIPERSINAISFLSLAKNSNVKIESVLSACKYLIEKRLIIPVTGRGGKKIGCYKTSP